MNRVVLVALVAIIGLFAWRQRARHVEIEQAPLPALSSAEMTVERGEHPAFRCDGRERCREMRSCDEAQFFLRNCPNTKMDGDNDGIPCEDQLCGHQR